MASYEPASYWKALLDESFDESGVGYPQLSRALNRAMYRSCETSVLRALKATRTSAKGAKVLDVGSGTGIWIDFWRRQGAEAISGVDLTEASVRRLRDAWPDFKFEQADVGDSDTSLPGDNEIVSAMSVLLHIVDESRFERAFVNLGEALRPGGTLLLIEPVVTYRWWGPPFGEHANSKARPLAQYEQALDSAGLRLEAQFPATILLANVIDARTRLSFQLFQRYWNLIGGLGRSERLSHPLAAILRPLDLLATRVARNGPSAKVLLARRV